MRRLLPWLAIAGALAAVVVFALPLLTSAPESDVGGAAVEGDVTGEATREASLVGRGAAEIEPVATGETIRGRVVDDEDRPLASVPVELRERARSGARERLADRIAQVAGPGEKGRLLAEAVSDAEGRFALPLPAGASRQLYVDARVEPPRCAVQADVYLRGLAVLQSEVLVRVLEGTRLEGEVVDAAGAGVAAFVEAYLYAAGIGRVAAGPVETSPPAGRFTLGALPAGEAYVAVTVPGRMRLRGLRVQMPHEGVLTIRLGGDTGRIAGTVRGGDEEPVANAQLLLGVGDEEGRYATVLGTTGADGTYRIEGVPAGRLSYVQVLATGYPVLSERPPLARWSGAVVEDGKETRLDLVLERGCVVEGRVTDDATGAPLAGAKVYVALATASGSREEALHDTSDADGRFRIEGVPPGLHLLLAEHATHFVPGLLKPRTRQVRFERYSQEVAIAPPELQLLVMPSERVVRRDLALSRGGEVRGRVLGPDDEPVGGASVLALETPLQQTLWQLGYQPPFDATRTARTDAEGRFLLQGLAPGEGRVFVAVAPPLAGIPSEGVDVGPGVKTPELVLRLQPGATIVGRVVADGGEAAAAQVYFYGRSASGVPTQPTRTASDGSFRMEGVPPGTVQVSASSWQSGRNVQATVEDLQPGEVREGVELVFAQGVRVAGVLVDEQGRPLPRRRIQFRATAAGWSMASATTDASGAFEIEHAPEGELRATTWDPAGPQEVPLAGGRFTGPVENLRLMVPDLPVGILEGTILDPDGEAVPLARVRISGRPLDPDGYDGRSGLVAEQVVGGTFRRQASGLPPWRVEVSEARGAGGEDLNLKPWSQTFAEAPAHPVEIRLERGLRIAGRVVGPDGVGVADVTLSVTSGAAVTDDAGRFALGGLGEEEVKLTVRVPSGWVTPGPVSAVPGEEVVIRLARALAIAGVLRDEDGHALENGWVNANWPDETGARQHTSAQCRSDGRFRLEGFPPGVRVRLQAQTWGPEGRTFAPVVVEDVEAGTEDLVLTFAEGVSIEGTVETGEGRPYSACWVSVRRGSEKGEHLNFFQVDADGTFTVSGLEPGPHYLSVQIQDGSPGPEGRVVNAPATGVRFVVPASLSLSGRLEGPGDLGGYTVVVVTADGQGGLSRNTQSASDGSFRVGGLPEGRRLRIGATKQGSEYYGARDDVVPGSSGIVVALEKGLALSGRVEDAQGNALDGGYATASRKGLAGKWWCSVTDGRFRITGLPPGLWVLQVALPRDEQGMRLSHVLGTFEAGRTDLDLRLPR